LQKVALLSEQRKSSRGHDEPEYWMYDSGYLLFQVRALWPQLLPDPVVELHFTLSAVYHCFTSPQITIIQFYKI
jgi:hypothetical protein